jgi:mono/diheme cytochrome c family protein
MASNKSVVVYWAIIGLLLLTVAGLVLKFLVLGKTETGSDGRVAIVLDPSERAFVLNEMRQFLAGIQVMLDAAERNDPAAIARAARPLGMAAARNTPAGMAAKLPLEFKTLGFSVHGDFDRIAMDAESMKDTRLSLQQLSETMKKCVACHATYQLVLPAPAGPAPR